jgi:hypothetical protein
MNDRRNVYIGLQVARTTGATVGVITFEPKGTDVRDQLTFFTSGASIFLDEFVCDPQGTSCEDASSGGTSEIQGAARVDAAGITIEISHPLSSADRAHDFSLKVGDTIPFSLTLGLTCAETPFEPTCLQPATQVTDRIVVAGPPKPKPQPRVGVMQRVWMSRPASETAVKSFHRANGIQANFVFRVLPVAGSRLQVRWFVNGRPGRILVKARARRISTFMLSDTALPPGMYKCVLYVRPPGGANVAIATASARVS